MYVRFLSARERERERECVREYVSDHRSVCVRAIVFVSKDSV